ncbi:diacylglycerol/lipid kinase family protein [Flavobacterium crassostreae]|uniref:Diacylglycerol kinase n=1 Tax=Flavobacterium crassostreae TaxID=1763534 RepID=A0A1B9DXV9_9FLAO|nr:diacylglycerol kinase family protein [Flavobacterium crassostreae]OCB74516.1 diacylglycerol kinase [Flavobacterium crassostreae]
MEKNVLLIVNPISGDLDKSEIIAATTLFATNQNQKIQLYQTTGKHDQHAIQQLFYKNNPERVLIAGGDGTIKLVAEALEEQDIIFGLLPAGSANGLATDLDLPKSIEDCLKIAFQNHYISLDIISINGQKSMHLSDIGLNAELIKNYQNSTLRGKLGYALQAVNTLIEIEEPFLATITANDKLITCQARMIVIANSKKYGTGIVINPQGKLDDGKFELVILKNLDLVVLGQIIAGNNSIAPENIEIISTTKAKITSNRPVNFQIDGEYCGKTTQLDIILAPQKMKIAIAKPTPI